MFRAYGGAMDMATLSASHWTRLSAPAGAAERAAQSPWDALAAEAAEANAFYAPPMLHAALTHLTEPAEVRPVEAWDGERLIGLLPVALSPNHGRLPIACVTNWMHRHCFFGAPLVRAGQAEAAWRDMLAQIDAAPWAKGFLHLSGIGADGAALAGLRAACAAQGRRIEIVHSYERAMLRSDLSADDYWESQVRSKKRKEIRRLQKRLAELGVVAERRLSPGDDLSEWTAAFLALEASGWKGKEGTALGCRPADTAFFEAACADAFAQGQLHMLRIDLDERPIAMLVNFLHGEGAFSFKIAFDEELGRFSPGVLIEIANLHAVQSDPAIGWMDSCAAPDHPMIDSLWAERRTIVQLRVALHGSPLRRLRRSAALRAVMAAERVFSIVKALTRKGTR
jgi:CelD/BcsL family acetyltransferase involved in cellulose biosynthesis